VDLPRNFVIREQHHRIHNPFSEVKLADLGRVSGVGVDISQLGIEQARAGAAELGVFERLSFVHDDASRYVSGEPVDVVACIGATWIGNGVPRSITSAISAATSGGGCSRSWNVVELDDRAVVEVVVLAQGRDAAGGEAEGDPPG
jgi:hypothetical protein